MILLQKIIFAGVFIAFLSIGIGIIIGHFAIQKSNENSSSEVYPYSNLTREADDQNYKDYIKAIVANNIRENLRYFLDTLDLSTLRA